MKKNIFLHENNSITKVAFMTKVRENPTHKPTFCAYLRDLKYMKISIIAAKMIIFTIRERIRLVFSLGS